MVDSYFSILHTTGMYMQKRKRRKGVPKRQMERQNAYRDRVRERLSHKRERERGFMSDKGILLPHQCSEYKMGCFSSSLANTQDRTVPVIVRSATFSYQTHQQTHNRSVG